MRLRAALILITFMSTSYGVFNLAQWFYLSINGREWELRYWMMCGCWFASTIALTILTRKYCRNSDTKETL